MALKKTLLATEPLQQRWQQLSTRIDALSLRERIILFALAALVLVVAFNSLVLDPLFARQRALSQQISADQEQVARLQTEIQQAVRQQEDPDAANRSRLADLTEQTESLQARLQTLRNSLVPPEKMPGLLEDILQRYGALQLQSLKTLPVTSLAQAVANERQPLAAEERKTAATTAEADLAAASASAISADDAVYSHGVEIVVLGSYLQMLQYLQALEKMPWQVFWGKVTLKVDEYPQATLTLTLYTLSMDKRWLHL